MTYVIVETTEGTSNNELLAAPTKWIKWEKGGLASLRWPNRRYLSTLNALLNDAGSIPSADWEKYKCDIMCRNIPSLETAERMIERMLEQRKGSKLAASEAIPVTVQKTEDPMAEEENLHEFSSNLTKVVDGEDPFGDVKPLSQLMDLIMELKSLIESNQRELRNEQQEIRKELNKGFHHIQKTVLSSIRHELNSVKNHTTQSNSDVNQFNVKMLTCMEEFEDFEERLNDEEYRKDVHKWVDYCVGHELSPANRVYQIYDLLFDRKFIVKFSWGGRSNENKKHPMNINKNILNLFEYAGTTNTHKANQTYVMQFFKKMLKHANRRVNIKGTIKCVPRRTGIKRRAKKLGVDQQANQSELEDHLETEIKLMRTQPSPSTRTVQSSLQYKIDTNNQQSSEASGANIMIDEKHKLTASQTCQHPYNFVREYSTVMNPITNKKDMDMFEERLNENEFRKNIHNWVDKTVGHLPEPDLRMVIILDRLVDEKFLRSFSWKSTETGKSTLTGYTNFVKLFEYVSRTVLNQTIILNHSEVGNFFTNKLDPPM